MESELLWFALAALLVLLGLVGLVLPAIPGTPLLLAGLALAAWAEDFQEVGYGTLAVLGTLAFLGYFIDFAAGAFGARRFGASKQGVTGAFVGALLGLFFGLMGVVLGPFLGAVAGELAARRDLRTAGRAGFGAALGLALGAAAKLALAFTMIGIFVLARFLE
ncbi:MAG: DUF456 domain-containing protein [Myxococcota bacterium]